MLKIENLKKTYDRGKSTACEVLHGISLELPKKGFVCILGASGCGKTSLLNAIGGLDDFDSGSIICDTGELLKSKSAAMERVRCESFGYIFQNYYLIGEHSVAYNVYLGMHTLNIPHAEKIKIVKETLRRVGMLRYAKRSVSELSGGQQQRVAIARAIAKSPRVIFADEPTGNLDEANTMNICTLLKEISRESLVVMVTHEVRIAEFFADRIITVDDGNIKSDRTDWERRSIDAGESGAIYSAEYSESESKTDSLSLRVLTEEGAAPVSLTVAVERDRIVIKTDDTRVILCSESKSPPRIIEGKRPILDNAEKTHSLSSTAPEYPTFRGGLRFGMLLKEAFNFSFTKKIKSFGLGIFTVILSLMLVITSADFITLAHTDARDFATVDPDILELSLKRGPNTSSVISVSELADYRRTFLDIADSSGVNNVCVPYHNQYLRYTNTLFDQLGGVYVDFAGATYLTVDCLDENELVSGRMPERFDEIVLDVWAIDSALGESGELSNLIPDAEFFIGKQLWISGTRKKYTPTVVGICDSGGPSVYMSPEGILALASTGDEVITLSEYKRITNDSSVSELGEAECIVIAPNKGVTYEGSSGYYIYAASGEKLYVKDSVDTLTDESITASLIVADSYLDTFYRSAAVASSEFNMWCEDKEKMLSHLRGSVSDELGGLLNIEISDTYSAERDEYNEGKIKAIKARIAVTVSVITVSLIMLYVMQRSKIRERMDIITVYRLLGVPRRNLFFIFSVDSLAESLKFALPTVAFGWLVIEFLSGLGIELGLYYPLGAAALTFAAIAALRLLMALLPVLRLVMYSPAKLASKYDL